jgi:hypothetical protein
MRITIDEAGIDPLTVKLAVVVFVTEQLMKPFEELQVPETERVDGNITRM